MIPETQKKKLQSLRIRSGDIEQFDDTHIELINDIFKEYMFVIRKLYEKEPNIFRKFVNHDISELKKQLKSTKNVGHPGLRTEIFVDYKNSLEQSIDTAIEYITDYIQ